MAAPDMEVIKEIPGYKVILKAVLKSQIQQLVEQLASHTDEQSVILTASVSDGTLSHLGSDSGKSFLQDHEDIKSQFLGFCLKREHKRKQEEEQKKMEKEREEEMQRLQSFSPRNMGPRPSRFSSPRHEIHPVRLSRAVGGSIRGPGVRHEPYGLPRPRARSLNLGPQGQTFGGPPGLTRMPLNKEVIKVEPTDSDGSNQSAADVTSAQKQSEQSGSQPSSPSSVQTLDVKPEHADDNSTSANDASDMKFSDTQPAEGLGLDSDLSNLISGEQSGDQPTSSVSSDIDPNVNIKLEAISENDMELEITGVEPGMSSVDTSWAQNTAMGYDPSGATGNQADMQGQEGYNKDGEGLTIKTIEFYEGNVLRSRIVYNCDVCNKIFPGKNAIVRHMRLHTGDKPFKCPFCEMSYTRKFSMQTHVKKNHPSD